MASPRAIKPDELTITQDRNGKAVLDRNGKRFIATAAVTDTDAYTNNEEQEKPNMLFVPLKTREPYVSSKEMMVFIVMLVTFTVIHSSQHFEQDFATNSAMADLCYVYTPNVGFVTIATRNDYISWWPSFTVALASWIDNRELVAGNATTLGKTGPAVLLGKPLLMQRRLAGATFAMNGTAGHECMWVPRDYGQGRGPTCYGASMGWSGDDPLMGADGTPGSFSGNAVMYLDHIEDIIRAGSAWDPTDWIDSATIEVIHYFQVWLPTQQRIATVKLAASFDSTGRVLPRDRDGQLPVFRTQEPFVSQTDPKEFYGEMLFYCVMAYYLLVEIAEVWDCICMQELLLPLEILVQAFQLSLLEIKYFHAKTSEVYDPRDPTTHAAFTFPDTNDLEEHLISCIRPIKDTMSAEQQKLHTLRAEIANLGINARTTARVEYDNAHTDLKHLHTELMKTHAALDREIEIAETAAILQLAVMWHNRWSMDFPPNYLNDIGNPEAEAGVTIGEDGKAAFCAVNWVRVARDYTHWIDLGRAHETVEHKREGGHFTFKTHRLGIVGESKGRQSGTTDGSKRQTPQEKHFTQLAPLVDYLNMLRDTLSLHQQLVGARSIRHWNGPRIKTSHTIDQEFQSLIQGYNEVGNSLIEEMSTFPGEIVNGFHDPDPIKAETTKINARRIQKALLTKLNTAQALGLFFPGSTIWELRRKLRAKGHYSNYANVRLSLSIVPENATIVSSGSMSVYLQAAETAGVDCAADYTVSEEESKQKRTQTNTATNMVNPMHADLLSDDGGSGGDGPSDKRKLLEEVPFVSALSKKELDTFADGCEVVKYDSNAVIVQEGDQGEGFRWMFVLVGGDAAVFKEGVNDGDALVHYRQGELFGEKGWYSRSGRQATVKAGTDGATCLKLGTRAVDVLASIGFLDGNYETVGQAAMISGMPEWRDWIPHSARHVVNHDGQFFAKESSTLEGLRNKNFLYLLWLYVSEGFETYSSNGWNVLEFSLYSLFMVAFYCKIEMWRLEPVLKQEVLQAINGEAGYVEVARFDYLAWLYMMTLTPNACIMWIKLFKYIGMVPQMDILIRVLSKAVPSVTIFTFVAIIPVLGLAYSFTAVFGDTLYRYSTVSLSLNTLLRMSVGDFDFEELFEVNPTRAVVMFWLSALLIVFCLINIFVAIILNAYDLILQSNPDANDPSQFISMVIMQAKRTAMDSLSFYKMMKRDSLEPHVLVNHMERIEDETYWDIFEGYFTLGGKGVDKVQREHADELGGEAAASSASMSSRALDTQLQQVVRTVDQLAAKQQSYDKQAKEIAQQQKQILGLLQAMQAKANS